MADDLLTRLQASQDGTERKRIVLEYSLNALDPELRAVVFAAAIPHWFDADFLSALLKTDNAHAFSWLNQLQSLSFIENIPERGFAIHEETRTLLLDLLWSQSQSQYKQLSQNAFEYCASQTSDDYSWKMEEIYHQVIADPDQGGKSLCDTGWIWQNPPNYLYSQVELLAKLTSEHLEKNRLAPLASGWTKYWLAHVAYKYSRSFEANAILGAMDPVWLEDDNYLKASTLWLWGDVHYRLSELPEARARYAEALPIFRAIGARLGEANCIRSLGDVEQMLAEYEKARQRYEQALPIYSAIGDRLGEANCIKSLGNVHVSLLELPEARARYKEALPLFRAIGSRRGEANCIRSLGNVHVRLSELPEARARYKEALLLYRAIGDRLGEANCIRSLGDVNASLSELPEARARYAEALPLYRTIGDRLGEANCIRSLGNVHVSLSELPEARARYAEALPIYRAIGSRLGEANCIRSLGDVELRLAEYEKARQRYEQALPIFRAIGDRLGQANCIRSLGDVFCEEENWDAAGSTYAAALEYYQILSMPAEQASIYSRLGNLLDRQKSYIQAIEAYTQAVDCFPNEPMYLLNRANAYLKLRDLPHASEDVQNAQALQADHAYLHLRFADLLLLQGDTGAARGRYQAALDKMPRLNSAWFGIGRSYILDGELEQAKAAYQSGLGVTDDPKELADEIDELHRLDQEHPQRNEMIQAILAMLPAR